MHETKPVTASALPEVTSASGGTLYLVLIQVTSRAFTFLGNQFILRYLSPSLLGLAVQLELLSVTILYFSRESLRVALQRRPVGGQNKSDYGAASQQVVNSTYLVVLVGLIATAGFGYTYLHGSSLEVLNSVDFRSAFKLYTAATLIELLAEPCFAIIQLHALYQVRARAETIAAMSRCVAACTSTLIMNNRHVPASVLPFAVGQLFYATVLLLTYLAAVVPLTMSERFSLMPRIIATKASQVEPLDCWLGLFSKPLLSLTATFYAQSVFKLLLTQGDALILSFLTNLKSQGAFALASNYGGLLSRLVFQPVEESSRNVFGRLLNLTQADDSSSTVDYNSAPTLEKQSNRALFDSSDRSNDDSNDTNDSRSKDNRTQSIKQVTGKTHSPPPSENPVSQALAHLCTALHLYTLFSLPILSIMPPLLPLLSRLVLSSQWRNPTTTALLTAYLYYLPFIAVNGVLDAFVTTVARPAQLRFQGLGMAGVTAIYGVVAWALMASSSNAAAVRACFGITVPVGSHGLVLANMVNMALRIAWSIWFIGAWVRDNYPGASQGLWRRCLPSLGCVVVAVVVGAGLRTALMAEGADTKSFLGLSGLSVDDVGYVTGGGLVLGSTMLLSEHQFLVDLVVPLIPERLAAKIQPYLPTVHTKQA